MTDESNERIKKIAALQVELETAVKKSESTLFEILLSNWETIRQSPELIRKIYKKFESGVYRDLMDKFLSDMKTVLALNEEYFIKTATLDRIKEISKIVSDRVDQRLGVEVSGKIIQNGYMDTLVQDTTAKRQVQNFFFRTRDLKDESRLRIQLKQLVKGVQDQGGIVNRFFDNYVYDTYQEADRLAQNDYADQLGMEAAIYIGGLIDGSRPFCIERNKKIFTKAEIALWGTPNDKFGGYSNKETGMFNGKPKDGYDPFTQCGGHRCRHHLSHITKEYAVRLDKTLIISDGKLIRKEE